jgi:hypothetical protein
VREKTVDFCVNGCYTYGKSAPYETQFGETMSLPKLTHLQFQTLKVVSISEISGSKLREYLTILKIRQKSAAFYLLMQRLKLANLIAERKECRISGKTTIRESFYSITKLGRSEVQKSVEFYSKGEK